MRSLLALVLPFSLAVGAPDTSAQDGDDEIICVTIAYLWRGSAEDVANIRAVPVPQTFRGPFEGGGCARWSLVESSLLQWHLRLGDETTTSQALEYLESTSLPEPAPTHENIAALRRTHARLLPTLRTIQQLRSERQYAEASELLHGGVLASLYQAQHPFDQHRFLADQYLTAARFYGSPEFLRRAEPHVEAMRAYATLLAEFAEGGPDPASYGLEFAPDHEAGQTLLFYRYDTLRLALLGEGEGARDFPQLADRRVVDRLEELAWEAKPFNMLDELSRDDEELRELLDRNGNYARQQVAQWTEQAFTALAVQASVPLEDRNCTPEPFELATIALFLARIDGDASQISEGYRQVGWPAHHDDQRVALQLARADCALGLIEALQSSDDEQAIRTPLDQGFEAVMAARQMVQPDQSPGRFRQIAQRYLVLAEHCARIIAADADRSYSCPSSYNPHTLMYFETTLAALPSIRGVTLESDNP